MIVKSLETGGEKGPCIQEIENKGVGECGGGKGAEENGGQRKFRSSDTMSACPGKKEIPLRCPGEQRMEGGEVTIQRRPFFRRPANIEWEGGGTRLTCESLWD